MTTHQIRKAGRLWLDGLSTAQIAKTMKVSENKIWNRMEQIKAQAHVIQAQMEAAA